MPAMKASEPREHHYVPQFYMRRFACADDKNKVRTLERYGQTLVADRKSIERIGYENHLHDFVESGEPGSIELDLNKVIETPFSNGRTWCKIVAGDYAALDRIDGLSIYGFARHLQRRNLATLRFMETEHARYLAGQLNGISTEGHAMHRWLAETPGGAHQIFRAGAMDTTLPADADAINIIVCRAPIPFRTTTNPTLVVSQPGVPSVMGPFFDNLRTWWLSLDHNCGAFITAGGPPEFSIANVPAEVARIINRRYLVQMLHGEARYMIADDSSLEADLKWAGFAHDQQTTHGFRYRATTWTAPEV